MLGLDYLLDRERKVGGPKLVCRIRTVPRWFDQGSRRS